MDPSPAFSSDSSDYFGNAVVLLRCRNLTRNSRWKQLAKLRSWPEVLPEPGETPAWEETSALLTSHAGPEAA